MELLPEDLGAKWHVAVVRHRTYGTSVAWAKPVEPRLGRLGRLWTRDMKLSEEVAAATLPMASDTTLGYTYGLGIPAGIVALLVGAISASSGDFGWTAAAAGMAAGSLYGSTVALPRHTVRKLHKAPLKLEEIERLVTNGIPGLPPFLGELANRFFRMWNRGVGGDQQPDSLEQAFLALALDVLRSDNVPEASQTDLRLTLRALGDAVANLPILDSEATYSIDAADLKAEAELLRERADREADPVVAESLRRQAEAHGERARASEHASVSARRVRALREELRAQIDALRTALPAFGRAAPAAARASVRVDTASFARLSESIRSVAREANAVAEAEEELHAATWAGREDRAFGTAATTSVNEEQVQQIRRG